MKFRTIAGQVTASAETDAEYRSARAIGNVRIGDRHLFYRAGVRAYILDHADIRRSYRRVMRVPMKMCCGAGSMDVEYLVVEGDRGELAQVLLPDTRAAQALMAELKARLPHVEFAPRPKPEVAL